MHLPHHRDPECVSHLRTDSSVPGAQTTTGVDTCHHAERPVTVSSGNEEKPRQDHEPPAASVELGWRYHHLGIPTTIPREGEIYLKEHKVYVSGFTTSPYGIEWMRFEPDSPISDLVKTVPHICFEVDNLDEAIRGKEVLTAPNSPSEGARVALIIHNGAPVELIEFTTK